MMLIAPLHYKWYSFANHPPADLCSVFLRIQLAVSCPCVLHFSADMLMNAAEAEPYYGFLKSDNVYEVRAYKSGFMANEDFYLFRTLCW